MLVKDQPDRFILRADGSFYYAVGHPNTRIAGTATVEPGAQIQDYAAVYQYAKILGSSVVRDRAGVTSYAVVDRGSVIQDDAIVEGHAHVDGTIIQDNAYVAGQATVYRTASDNVHISGAAVIRYAVSGEAKLMGGTLYGRPIYIFGPRWPVWLVAPGMIKIGCQVHTIDEWLAPIMGSNVRWRDYCTGTEIKLYRTIVRAIQRLEKLHSPWEEQ